MASDIVIGLSPSGAFTRTMNGAGDTATYQATDPVVTIAALDLQNDINAGLNVVVTTADAALSAGNLFFQNNSIVKLTGGNTTLSLLAD